MKKFLLYSLLLAGLFTNIAHASPKLTLGFVAGAPGDTVNLPVTFANDGSIVGIQFDIQYDNSQLTSGVPVAGAAILSKQNIAWNEPSPGTLRIIIIPTPQNQSIDSGVIATIPYTLAGSNTQNNLLTMTNVTMSLVNADSTIQYSVSNGIVANLNDALTDSDADGIIDNWEISNGLNPLDASDASVDADNDGLSNIQEYQLGTNPTSADTDLDGLPDGWEVAQGFNPLLASDANTDADSDGLTNLSELQLGTDPNTSDTDGDGMPDGWESSNGLNPLGAGDASMDNDSDTLNNLTEFSLNTNPQSADTDGDGMPDDWEQGFGLIPNDASDATMDADGDGINNLTEYLEGRNPIISSATYPGLILEENPVVYWQFEETTGSVAVDAANDNDATYVGVTLGQPGLVTDSGNSVSIAQGDYIYRDALSVGTQPAYSYEAWVSLRSHPSGNASLVGERDATGNSPNIGINSSGQVYFSVWVAGVGHKITGPQLLLGTIYHVVGVKDPVVGMRLYVNGQLVGTDPFTGNSDGRTIMTMGKDEYTGLHIDGVLDEVVIYDKALTPIQIDRHFKKGDLDTDGDGMSDRWESLYGLNPQDPSDATLDMDGDGIDNLTEFLQGSDPSILPSSYAGTVMANEPIAYWQLEETAGTVALDTANNNDATYVGVALGQPGLVNGSGFAVSVTDGTYFYRNGLPVNTLPAFSLESWVSLRSYPTQAAAIMGDAYTYGNSTSIHLLPGGQLEYWIWDGTKHHTITGPKLEIGTIYHIVGTKDSVSGMSLFVNGQLVGINTYTGYGDGHTTMTMGKHEFTKKHIDGLMDEVAVYDKAITIEQVATHFKKGDLDSDGDGMPDRWEQQFGLNPQNPNDATLDLDGDGVNNVTEYLQGSAPTTLPASYTNTVMADAPVAYWQLEETTGTVAIDTANNNDATHVGVTLGQDGLLSGSSYAVSTSQGKYFYRNGLAVGTLPAYSYEAWVLLRSYPSTGNACLVGESDSTGNSPNLGVNSSGQVYFSVWVAGVSHKITGPQLLLGTIYHVVGVKDPVVGMSLYVNGQLVGTDPYVGNSDGRTIMTMGKDDYSNLYIDGVIDEVAVYDKALTSAQIDTHFKTGGVDSDGDGMPDEWEQFYGLNPQDANDATLDLDGDGKNNLSEFLQGSDPTTSTANYASTVMADGPIAYWQLDETAGTVAMDTANNHDATYVGVTLGQPGLVAGTGYAASIVQGDYFYRNALSVSLQPAFSFESWVKLRSYAAGNTSLMGEANATGNSTAIIISSGKKVKFSIYDGAVSHKITGPVLELDTVYHIVGVKDAVAGMSLYVNGQQVGTDPYIGNSNGNTTMTMGKHESTDLHIDGLMDEVAIYDKALTSAEIANHYTAGGGN